MNHVFDESRRQNLCLQPGAAGRIGRFGNMAGGETLFESFERKFQLPARAKEFQN